MKKRKTPQSGDEYELSLRWMAQKAAEGARRFMVEGSFAHGGKHHALITVITDRGEAHAIELARARSERYRYGYDTFKVLSDDAARKWDTLAERGSVAEKNSGGDAPEAQGTKRREPDRND